MAEEIPQAEEQKKDKPPYLFCGCVGLFIFFMFGAYTLFAGDQKLGGDGESLRNTLYGPNQPGEPGSGVGGTVVKSCIEKANANAAKWVNKVNEAAAKYGQDPALMLAQLEDESGINPDPGPSKAGALGMAQFMPDTWRTISNEYDIDGNGDGKENIMTPEDAIMAQNAYNYKIQKFLKEKNIEVSVDNQLASYNAGEWAVYDYAKGTNKSNKNPNHKVTGGVPPFGETQRYIVKIKAFYKKYAKCLNMPVVNTYEGIHPNHQKLLDAMNGWGGYNAYDDCHSASIALIQKAFPSAPNILPRFGKEDVVNNRQIVPSLKDLEETNQMLSQGKIVMWYINGDGRGQHWIIPIKIEDKNDGYYMTYIENVNPPSKITKRVDKKNSRGWVILGRTPQGSEAGVRGGVWSPPGVK